MNKTQQKKAELIRKILDNSTYLPESGLHRGLSKQLLAWSVSNLADLLIIIELKEGLIDAQAEKEDTPIPTIEEARHSPNEEDKYEPPIYRNPYTD